MKKIILNLLLIIVPAMNVLAQPCDEHKNIINNVIGTINSKNVEELKKYLADDFTISEYSGNIAVLILNQIISQLNDEVAESKFIDEQKNGNLTIIQYEFNYNKLGNRLTTFTINDENKICRLDVMDIGVKTLSGYGETRRSDKLFFTNKFEVVDNLILVEAKVNDKIKYFLFDSGAPRLALNSRYYRDENDKRRVKGTTKGVNGTANGVDIYHLQSFNFNGIELNDQDVMTMDFLHLEEECGKEIHGLIGFDIMKDYDILFDYQNSLLVLIQPQYTSEYLNHNSQYQIKDEVDIIMKKHIPIVTINIGNCKYAFGIDSGASRNLIAEDLFESLKQELIDVNENYLVGVDNNRKNVKNSKLKNIIIGSTYFENTIALFSDISHLNNDNQNKLDGLIGYEILSYQPTLLSFKNNKMIFF
ncbi:MAG: aspartyl protease family protein [Prevotellaceae bacterium]|jgi:hypothetical protein|nr:aspartyl protease family protein [Prevotellaceae bacterium]